MSKNYREESLMKKTMRKFDEVKPLYIEDTPSLDYFHALAKSTIDNDSMAYFMTEMTQDEFKNRLKGLEKSQYEFNKVKK